MLVNDIHNSMMIFMMHLTSTKALDKGLRLNSSLAGQLLLNISLQISTLLPTLKERTKQPTMQPFNGIHENSGDRYSQVLSSKGLPQTWLSPGFAWLFMFDKPPKNQSMLVNDIHSHMMIFMMY